MAMIVPSLNEKATARYCPAARLAAVAQIGYHQTTFCRRRLFMTATFRTQWRRHDVRRLTGEGNGNLLPAQFQIVTEDWNKVVALPYIAHVPEKDMLLMLISCGYPHRPMFLSGSGDGTVWSMPEHVERDPAVRESDTRRHHCGVSLTYLGGGRAILCVDKAVAADRYSSEDYGRTWAGPMAVHLTAEGKYAHLWNPCLVDRDLGTNRATRLMESGYTREEGVSRAFIRSSDDGGKTWGHEIWPPEWRGVDEVTLLRAKNGDIVAACRTDSPEEYKGRIDHYEGLAVSVSNDNGRTWSALKRLHEWGRHHPSMVLMPNGDIVMTYVVRLGYPETSDGYPQFGVEAVVSRDHGQTWDMEHRYVLHAWKGTIKTGPKAWWASSQCTSSVLLPDKTILTAFGTGYRCCPGEGFPPPWVGFPTPRDVGLVKWMPVGGSA
jgi:hypothetical protein